MEVVEGGVVVGEESGDDQGHDCENNLLGEEQLRGSDDIQHGAPTKNQQFMVPWIGDRRTVT